MENQVARVYLKKGREKSLNKRHPWLFSGAVERIDGDVNAGDILAVCRSTGDIVGKGFYNPHSQIWVRMLSFSAQAIDKDFFKQRLDQAIQFRQKFILDSNAYRLIHGEADGLPGLIVDRYAEALVIQFSSLGMANQRALIVELLQELLQPNLIIERSEAQTLQEEGLPSSKEILYGSEQDTELEILENGVRFRVNVLAGQKTGFFLDQRENRKLMAQLCAGKRLLNCFSYTGGFSVAAALAGADTTSVEISQNAQDMAQKNFALNGLDPDQHSFITANVFDYLREAPRDFDVIILDPPAFVKNRKHLSKAARAYQDINRLAMKLSQPDGLVLTCSCSHYMDWELFQKIIFSAAIEANKEVQIIQRLGHAIDHPISVFHPEGEYLKAFLLRVL